MQNKTTDIQTSLRDVMDRYSPIVGGRTGFTGGVLKLVSRAVEAIGKYRGLGVSTVPVPEVIFQSRNIAGQTIATNNVLLAKTFKRMETTLQNSFASASRSDATLGDRQQFVNLAQQVQKDAAILAAACFISQPEGDAKYKFTLEPQPGQHIPLKDAFAAVQRDYKTGCDNQVEFIRFGTDRPVVLMRPVKGFKKAGQKTPAN